MKKHLFPICIISCAALLFGGRLGAQDKTHVVTCPEGSLQVQYLVEKDSTVLLLCRYTPDAAVEGQPPYVKNVSGKTVIATEDGEYTLLRTFHIPLRDEAEMKYAYIKAGQPALNCVLEFEKFAFDETFDLVEKGTESPTFSLQGLKAGALSTDEMDADTFLAATPYSEYGYRYENGTPVHYFKDGGIDLLSTAWPYFYEGIRCLSVGFQIVNGTNGPLAVKFSDVSASAQRLNKKKKSVKCDIKLLDFKSADKGWKELDKMEVRNEVPSNAGQVAANAATRAAFDTGVSALGSLGLLAVGLAVRYATEPDYEPYLKERNEERERLMKSYLTESTLAPGDTLSTFVSIRYYDDPSSTTVALTLNGETYNMKY